MKRVGVGAGTPIAFSYCAMASSYSSISLMHIIFIEAVNVCQITLISVDVAQILEITLPFSKEI